MGALVSESTCRVNHLSGHGEKSDAFQEVMGVYGFGGRILKLFS